jgi:hypothetical protein
MYSQKSRIIKCTGILGWHLCMLTGGVNDNITEYYNTTPTTTKRNYNIRTLSTPTSRFFACSRKYVFLNQKHWWLMCQISFLGSNRGTQRTCHLSTIFPIWIYPFSFELANRFSYLLTKFSSHGLDVKLANSVLPYFEYRKVRFMVWSVPNKEDK